MNSIKIKLIHKYFSRKHIQNFSFRLNKTNIEFNANHGILNIIISGKKNVPFLKQVFFDIHSLLFIYLGSFPKIESISENGTETDISALSLKYTTSNHFYKHEAAICHICPETINETILDKFNNLNRLAIYSLEALMSESYDKIMTDHIITLLLHIIDGISDDRSIKAKKTILQKRYSSCWLSDNLGNYAVAVYMLCEKHFFYYHKKYNCEILSLLKCSKYDVMKIASDTRNSYSHFLNKNSLYERLTTGDDMLIWFDIFHYAIRLKLIDDMNVVVNEEVVKEYYYILHDWILEIKYKRNDLIKSNTYKTAKAFEQISQKINFST